MEGSYGVIYEALILENNYKCFIKITQCNDL